MTRSLSKIQSTANVGGIAVGETVELALADGVGNLTWMVATTTDANGNALSPGALFFTGYTVSGVCSDTYTFDAPFHVEGGSTKDAQGSPSPHQTPAPYALNPDPGKPVRLPGFSLPG